MLGVVSAGYLANKWGRYVHLLYISQHIWGIIICRRQLLQFDGQLLYPSTVLVECWKESLQDTPSTIWAGMYIYYTYHSINGGGGGGGLGILFVADSVYNLMVSYCIHLLC